MRQNVEDGGAPPLRGSGAAPTRDDAAAAFRAAWELWLAMQH